MRIFRIYVLLLFVGYSFSDETILACKQTMERTYFYKENGESSSSLRKTDVREFEIIFNTNKKTFVDSYNQEGRYTEQEIFFRWSQIYNNDPDHYTLNYFNRVSGELRQENYYSMSMYPELGVRLMEMSFWECSKKEKLL